jgi:DNA processing protein
MAQDKPPVIYVRGSLPPDRRCVACVGTRQPTEFGRIAARRISRFLAAHGWSIVSGLAVGVDTICHEGALEAGGHTVAVLANGLDTVYPRQNTGLAERILAAGGALLSEQPLGTPALPKHLFRRNRIQSGMSAGTVVMQTDIVGGTMHTVRHTMLQGRLLFVPVPQAEHAAEDKSRGLLALTQRTGNDLARLLDAKESYARLLERKFADRSIAIPLSGREDYTRMLAVLEAAALIEGPKHIHASPALQLAFTLGPERAGDR